MCVAVYAPPQLDIECSSQQLAEAGAWHRDKGNNGSNVSFFVFTNVSLKFPWKSLLTELKSFLSLSHLHHCFWLNFHKLIEFVLLFCVCWLSYASNTPNTLIHSHQPKPPLCVTNGMQAIEVSCVRMELIVSDVIINTHTTTCIIWHVGWARTHWHVENDVFLWANRFQFPLGKLLV